MRKKYIYVILSKTLTRPAKIICKYTGGKYSHASISLDKDLNEMYSFARFKYHTPLVSGFTKETINSLSLGRADDVKIKVFRIPVTERQYNKLEKQINYFKRNSKKYMYNLFGLIFYPMGIEFNIKNTYICTEFVSKCLASLGIQEKKLMRNRITPDQLLEILIKYEYYSGTLANYCKTLNHEAESLDFFEKENFLVVIGKTITQITKLIYRKIV